MAEKEPKRQLPVNWPKDRPLPTIEQARQAVREGNKELEEKLDELQRKARKAFQELAQEHLIWG